MEETTRLHLVAYCGDLAIVSSVIHADEKQDAKAYVDGDVILGLETDVADPHLGCVAAWLFRR